LVKNLKNVIPREGKSGRTWAERQSFRKKSKVFREKRDEHTTLKKRDGNAQTHGKGSENIKEGRPK